MAEIDIYGDEADVRPTITPKAAKLSYCEPTPVPRAEGRES